MATLSIYDHLLMGSPLRRRGACIVISAALALVLAFATIVHLGLLAGMRFDVVLVFYQALVISSLLALVPIMVLWFLDRRERETPSLCVAAFLWGGCIATALSLPFNTAFFRIIDIWVAQNPILTEVLGPQATVLIAAPISAPIAEEIAKAAGVLLLFWLLRAEFDNMRDGFIYGALIGIGFNWFEAALYVAQGYAQHGEAPYGLQFGFRYALFGLGGHALFTGLFGVSVGLAMQTQRMWLRILAPIGGLILAMAAHMINNVLPLFAALANAEAGESPQQVEELPSMGFLSAFITGSMIQLMIFVPFFLIIALAVWRSGVWERRVIREELAAEVGSLLSADEYSGILHDRMLRTRRIDRMHPRASAALVNAQHELAFRKRRVRDEGSDPEQDPLVAGWREDIRRLRDVA
ncbi:MAG: PrsW family intramembrane metalloprotease [Rhizobiales bacterium]|nr:PrsW family intramembrane metalloprotease [Hyphomicrobiales bacterium]